MTDYRQLCVELLTELENAIRVIYAEDGTRHISGAYPVINSVKNSLAEPEPEGPTDNELAELYRKAYYECENRQGDAAQVFALRAVLARWGK